MPRLFRVVVPVPDMQRADAFYSRVLRLKVDEVAPTRHYFDCGETILALVDPRGHGREFRPNTELVYLAVADLEATFERAVESGAGAHEADGQGWGIAVRPWGERSFYVKDPFGNPLCFVDEATLFVGTDRARARSVAS